ncbi:hypothetical protein L915_01742 [Phytophthora nicotianae]|uniref:Uncharacterized protein n=1 Tax=Phytophthora nicotianae TaxID=4792 RepID=W2JQN2_PHYNI|nr:hypothetical protein L915_01742 [Phytophthora nicotianae]ETL48710.1 hypothetical protein L916_01709 [Phytophthora nicotianae]
MNESGYSVGVWECKEHSNFLFVVKLDEHRGLKQLRPRSQTNNRRRYLLQRCPNVVVLGQNLSRSLWTL